VVGAAARPEATTADGQPVADQAMIERETKQRAPAGASCRQARTRRSRRGGPVASANFRNCADHGTVLESRQTISRCANRGRAAASARNVPSNPRRMGKLAHKARTSLTACSASMEE
jgi:hypothetical protein